MVSSMSLPLVETIVVFVRVFISLSYSLSLARALSLSLLISFLHSSFKSYIMTIAKIYKRWENMILTRRKKHGKEKS